MVVLRKRMLRDVLDAPKHMVSPLVLDSTGVISSGLSIPDAFHCYILYLLCAPERQAFGPIFIRCTTDADDGMR